MYRVNRLGLSVRADYELAYRQLRCAERAIYRSSDPSIIEGAKWLRAIVTVDMPQGHLAARSLADRDKLDPLTLSPEQRRDLPF